jgi:hypothetical protein
MKVNKALQEIWDKIDATRALQKAQAQAIDLIVERRQMQARGEQARKSKAKRL